MFSIYHTPFFSARLPESLSTPGPPGPNAYSHSLPEARCTLGARVGEGDGRAHAWNVPATRAPGRCVCCPRREQPGQRWQRRRWRMAGCTLRGSSSARRRTGRGAAPGPMAANTRASGAQGRCMARVPSRPGSTRTSAHSSRCDTQGRGRRGVRLRGRRAACGVLAVSAPLQRR